MSEWFQAKVKFTRQLDNGLIKQVTEQYLVDSMSFTECEARVLTEQGEGIREVTCQAIARSNIKEVIIYGDTDLWFRVKVTYNLMDEDTEKEKKITTYMLCNANDAKEAYERTEEHLKEMLVPFSIPEVKETKIIDVYQYQKAAPKGFKKVVSDLEAKGFTVTASMGSADAVIESKIGKPIDPTQGQAVSFEMGKKSYMEDGGMADNGGEEFDPEEWLDGQTSLDRAQIRHNFTTMHLGGDTKEFVTYLSSHDLTTEEVSAVIEWLCDPDPDEEECAMESEAVTVGFDADDWFDSLDTADKDLILQRYEEIEDYDSVIRYLMTGWNLPIGYAQEVENILGSKEMSHGGIEE